MTSLNEFWKEAVSLISGVEVTKDLEILLKQRTIELRINKTEKIIKI